jgi:hypothetical protein
MARIDQQHREAARLEQLEQRDPVHAGGLHGHRVRATGGQPIGQGVEIEGEAGELAYRLVVAIGRHGHKVGRAADVYTGGVGVGDGEGSGLARLQGESSVALRHRLVHHSGWNVAPHRVRRLAHSLKRDIARAAANRQGDSPMSMTSPRTTLDLGQLAPLLHRSFAAPLSTLPQVTQCFFGAICGSGQLLRLMRSYESTHAIGGP